MIRRIIIISTILTSFASYSYEWKLRVKHLNTKEVKNYELDDNKYNISLTKTKWKCFIEKTSKDKLFEVRGIDCTLPSGYSTYTNVPCNPLKEKRGYVSNFLVVDDKNSNSYQITLRCYK